MSRDGVFENLDTVTEYVDESRKNGKLNLSASSFPENSFPELVLDVKNAFSVDTTVRKAACDLCKIVLTRLTERFGDHHIDICAILGFIEEPKTEFQTLRLKGAAGFQPNGMLKWEDIKVGEGIIGQAASDKRPIITNDLRNETRASTTIEQSFAQLSEKLALLAHPLILASGELAGVLVLGKFHSGALPDRFFRKPDFTKILDWLATHIATTLDNAKWVSKARLLRKYLEHERRINDITRQFYSDAITERNLKKLMETICIECMSILNSGNPEQPFYQNFLFYEYQEYRQRFVLRSYKYRPKSVLLSFHIKSRHYKEYMQDGQVKCLESQARFVQNRGKYPYIVRYLFENKLEEIMPQLDANWSPAARGTAFIVPLFNGEQPLGFLLFWSRKQNRQYVNKPKFYLGPERRTTGRNDLRFFRSLQPLIASEYSKFKADEDRQRGIDDLESILRAIKEIILLEDQGEVLDRLAKFTAQSLNCEGCLIYLLNRSKNQLEPSSISGFQTDEAFKKELTFPLQPAPDQPKGPPAQIFESQESIIFNRGVEFRRFCGNQKRFGPFFKQLKSGRVISYLGQPIGKLGVIEVFNKAKLTPTAWSFFEEQDAIALHHIADAISTVLKRIEATASQVRSEKMKVTSELLLDISHELKNPLYASLIHVRKLKTVLNGHLLPADENGTLKTLGVIERNVEKAQRILSGMQNFQASETQMKREPVNLEKILRMVIQTNELLCEQQRITLGSEFLAKAPLVYGDELQLNQVFTNLVKNAMDAMPNGGMLQVRLYEHEENLQVEITDTGSGIPDAIKDRVFELFVTTKDSDKGTGLGLALSQRLIKQHHGKIEFETESGWGTKFFVTLPKFVEQFLSPVKPLEYQTVSE